MANNLNEQLQHMVQDLSGTLGVAVVDLGTGMVMGIHHVVPYFTQNFVDAAAAGVLDMFEGKNVRRIEDQYCELKGVPRTGSFINEIFFMTPKTYHYCISIREKNAVVMLVTSKDVNQGLAWSSLRNSIGKVVAALP
jgi:hypothetical protein